MKLLLLCFFLMLITVSCSILTNNNQKNYVFKPNNFTDVFREIPTIKFGIDSFQINDAIKLQIDSVWNLLLRDSFIEKNYNIELISRSNYNEFIKNKQIGVLRQSAIVEYLVETKHTLRYMYYLTSEDPPEEDRFNSDKGGEVNLLYRQCK